MPDQRHLLGLLLGTEEDWPSAFETLVRRLDPALRVGADTHRYDVERITVEPFDLRQPSRYSLVVDRLAYWYYVPREWLKKVALMDDVYLLNNPFTFQSMEKHAAYCAMIRLGLKVPETWLVPYKQPPDNPRFPYTAAKYNRPFDLREVAEQVGYPLYMKPYDGGAWVGVTPHQGPRRPAAAYDESGSGSCTCRPASRASTSSRARCRSAPRRWSCASRPTGRSTTATASATSSSTRPPATRS
jgi:hypothetical protein